MNSENNLSIAAGCVVLSLLLLTILYFDSGINRMDTQPFTRTFREIAEQSKVYDVKYNSYYIAGATEDSIYLGNLTAPMHVIGIDTRSLDTQHIAIKVKELPKLSLNSTRLSIKDNHFFLSDGPNRTIITGHTGKWHTQHSYIVDEYFNDFEPIDSSFYAIRAYSVDKENILGTISTLDSQTIRFQKNLLEKQIDGIFCTDGMLHYVPYFDNLVYVYYYRNQYIVFDKVLNLIARSYTLDTISVAHVESYELASSSTLAMTSPPILVNRNTCIWNKFLLIQSPSLSSEESIEAFEVSSVIDLYNLETEKYEFSFHIPDFKNKKLSSFGVSGQTLVALYDHYMIAYSIEL